LGKGQNEAPGRRIYMNGNIPVGLGEDAVNARHVVQCARVSGTKDAPDRHHQFAHLSVSGFLVSETAFLHYLGVVRNASLDRGAYLFGRDRELTGLQRNPLHGYVEIAGEFDEGRMRVGADDEPGPIFERSGRALAVARAPVPLVGKQREHDGLGRAGGSGSDETGFLQAAGVKEVGGHADDAPIYQFSSRVFGCVDQVFADGFESQPAGVPVHPRSDKRSQILCRVAIA
jgi:hypothetical protein